MGKILIPTSCADDWKQLLKDPEKQWKTGYSARTIAYCWQDADGMPPEITLVLSQEASLKGLETIFAIPEHRTPLLGLGGSSCNDVWVIGKIASGLISISVEGKVSESFNQTINEWMKERTPNRERILK